MNREHLARNTSVMFPTVGQQGRYIDVVRALRAAQEHALHRNGIIAELKKRLLEGDTPGGLAN